MNVKLIKSLSPVTHGTYHRQKSDGIGTVFEFDGKTFLQKTYGSNVNTNQGHVIRINSQYVNKRNLIVEIAKQMHVMTDKRQNPAVAQSEQKLLESKASRAGSDWQTGL